MIAPAFVKFVEHSLGLSLHGCSLSELVEDHLLSPEDDAEQYDVEK
jgi:hypothetical protein